MPLPPPYRVKRLDQLKALRSLERRRVIQALSELGPSSVRDVAEHLDRVPESLYYHVATLEEVGLVVRRGSRPTRSRSQALYELVGLPSIDPAQRSPAFLEALDELCASSLRAATRHLSRSLDEERGRSGPRTHQGVVQTTARLSGTDRKELRRRMAELVDWVAERHDPRQAHGTLVTLAQSTCEDG
jgi:predicted ArsR family transcriptional regulator